MNRLLAKRAPMSAVIPVAALLMSLGVHAADAVDSTGGRFTGLAFMEPIGDDPFVPRFRLLGELRFLQAGGKLWVTPSNAILDGRSRRHLPGAEPRCRF